MADIQTDAAIAEAWPGKWAKANDQSRPGASKRRNQLRKAWATAKKLDALSEQGAACETCANFGLTRALGGLKTICELRSDFEGYQLADPANLCADWKARTSDREGE